MSHTRRLIAVLGSLVLSVGIPGTARAQTPFDVAQGALSPSRGAPALELRQGDTVVLIGNTLAERMQYFNHFETLLMLRFPDLQLRVRNLGWSGDALTLQPRPLNFGDASKHLQQQKADVILAFFGASESFAGEAGLPQFERDLETYLRTHASATYNGKAPPRLALISPIAHETLPHLAHVDVVAHNRDLERYAAAMRAVAAREKIAFVDLFTPSLAAMEKAPSPLTENGIHLNEAGDAIVGGAADAGTRIHAGVHRGRDRSEAAAARSAAGRDPREEPAVLLPLAPAERRVRGRAGGSNRSDRSASRRKCGSSTRSSPTSTTGSGNGPGPSE